MSVQIQTKEGAVGAEIKSKVDKKDDNRLKASLPVQFYISRDQFDDLAGMPRGWCKAFYDDVGAPIGNIELRWIKREFDFYGRFSRGEGKHAAVLEIKAGVLLAPRVRVENHGGTLIGVLIWPAFGDEADDAHELLGNQCDVKATLSIPNEGQADFVKDQNATAAAEASAPGTKKKGRKKKKTGDGDLPANVTSIFQKGDPPPDGEDDPGSDDDGTAEDGD